MGFFGGQGSIAIVPDQIAGLWGWFDASDDTRTSGSVGNIGRIYDKRDFGPLQTYNKFINSGTSSPVTSINGVRAATLTGSNYFVLLNPSESSAITTPITTGVSDSWEVFILGQYSTAGTIISQNISATLTQRQMQIFRQASAGGVGGYLTTHVLRGVEMSLNDNQDLNSNGFQAMLTHMRINNTDMANPNVFTSTSANYVGRGTLSVAQALETGSFIAIGARNNGASNPLAVYITGKLGEIVIYNALLSSSQRLGVKRYLAKKWGIIEATDP